MAGSFLVELLLILRHAYSVATHASIESLPSLLIPCLLNTDHHPFLVVSCSDARDCLMVLISLQFTSYSTQAASNQCSDLVPALGIPSSLLDFYLNIKPLLHRPAGLSLGIASHPQH